MRFLRRARLRLLAKFLFTFGWKGLRAVNRYRRRLKRGEYFPAFLFLSVTDRCNLSCRGCWVTPSDPPRELDPPTVHRIIAAANRQGSHFFGIMGGEPLLYPHLQDIFEQHPDSYFLLFTNGTLIDDAAAGAWARAGNVSPLISIEGLEQESDRRRGSRDVFQRTMAGLDACCRHGLVTGAATSVTRSNIDELVCDAFVDELVQRGVLYLWYYIYRPVGRDPSPELALTAEDIARLRRFLVEVRCRAPLLIVDAYWDHEGRALCPAVTGIGHHIGPGGDIEPCPPIQFAAENIGQGDNLAAAFAGSRFLRGFGPAVAPVTRGCVLLENPERLRAHIEATAARDSSGRGTGLQELAALTCRCGHDMGEGALPERHWLYRFAKRHWFFGFGAYG